MSCSLLAIQSLALPNHKEVQACGFFEAFNVYGLVTWAFKKLDLFASKGMGYYHAYWFIEMIRRNLLSIYDTILNKSKGYTFVDPEEAEKILKEGYEEIAGQEKAKKIGRDFVMGTLHLKKSAQMSGQDYNSCGIILLTGPSGVGKSKMARVLARALSTAPYVRVSAGDIDINDKKNSVVAQIFGGRRMLYGKSHSKDTEETNNLLQTIKRIPHLVIIIDEYDKINSPALDEVLRSAVDNGIVRILGEEVDLRNVTFILTSNELFALIKFTENSEGKSLSRTEKIDHPISAEFNKHNVDASRTIVERDKSAMNRITKVELVQLSELDHAKIAKMEFDRALLDYWKRYANTDLDLSDAYKSVAKETFHMDEQGRAIKILLFELIGTLSKNEKKIRGKKVKVYRDNEEERFVLVAPAD